MNIFHFKTDSDTNVIWIYSIYKWSCTWSLILNVHVNIILYTIQLTLSYTLYYPINIILCYPINIILYYPINIILYYPINIILYYPVNIILYNPIDIILYYSINNIQLTLCNEYYPINCIRLILSNWDRWNIIIIFLSMYQCRICMLMYIMIALIHWIVIQILLFTCNITI